MNRMNKRSSGKHYFLWLYKTTIMISGLHFTYCMYFEQITVRICLNCKSINVSNLSILPFVIPRISLEKLGMINGTLCNQGNQSKCKLARGHNRVTRSKRIKKAKFGLKQFQKRPNPQK